MAYLINRTPVARLRCLHALTKLIKNQHAKNVFYMGDLLYDREKINIHQFCDLLKEDKSLHIKYCPFLNNPLNKSGCYLTRGVNEDTTKRKEISNAVNSLDGLGIINRTERKLQLTSFGDEFTNVKFDSLEWLDLIRKALLKYGPMVGLLYQIHILKQFFNISYLEVGYPNTGEVVIKAGETVKISSGSQKDSNTRTKSALLAWAVTAGFIVPASLYPKVGIDSSHIDTNKYILKSVRNESFYGKKYFPYKIFMTNFETGRPLDYLNLSKNIGALREHGQEKSRKETLRFKNIILNRRFAIVFLLNKAFSEKSTLNFLKMLNFLKKKPSMFIIDNKNFEDIMKVESFIAFMAGIPFKLTDVDMLKPVTGINENILCLKAPGEVINYLNEIKNKVLVRT